LKFDPQKGDLIITMLYRMRFSAIAPFFFSLKESGYTGDLVAFVTMTDGDTITEMERHGIITIPFRFHPRVVRRTWWFGHLWRLLYKSNLPQDKKEKLAHMVFPLFYRRHLLYLEYLRRHRQKYNRVFITDCRDVFFQANPFSWNPPPEVHFFLEEPASKIGTSSRSFSYDSGNTATRVRTVGCGPGQPFEFRFRHLESNATKKC
jgi:hypothetical protein